MKIFTTCIAVLLFMLCMWIGEAAKTPDPYKVLGISRAATQDDIKKAFNKRSRQYHPDRNKQDPRAKDKFQKVVNAYQLLKDPERKKMYDMTGSDDPNAGMGMGGGGFGGQGFGINLDDILNMGFGGFGGGFGGQRAGGQRAGGGRAQGGQRTYTFSFGGGGGGGAGPGGFRFQM